MRGAAPRVAGALLFLVVPIGLALGAFGSAALRHELAEGFIPCPFRLITGVVCPFCGITHATLALGQGDVVGALIAHPLAPLVLGLVVWGSWLLVRARPATVFGRPIRPWHMGVLVGGIWAVNLVADALRA